MFYGRNFKEVEKVKKCFCKIVNQLNNFVFMLSNSSVII